MTSISQQILCNFRVSVARECPMQENSTNQIFHGDKPPYKLRNHPEAPDQRQTTRNATSCRNIVHQTLNLWENESPRKSIRNHNLETQRWQQSRPGESYSVATEDWQRVTQTLSRFHIPKGPITQYRLTNSTGAANVSGMRQTTLQRRIKRADD
jgi:hypothetical protein